jgi:hypothetical protein
MTDVLIDVIIKSITPKTDKKGQPYFVLSTDKGVYSTWSIDVANALHGATSAQLMIRDDGKYKNLLSVVSVSKVPRRPEAKDSSLETPSSRSSFPLSMKVAYAKDIYCRYLELAGELEKIPEGLAIMAVSIVEQIEDEFIKNEKEKYDALKP